MIDRFPNFFRNRDFVPPLLRSVLLIIFIFILFMMPSFAPGTELAVFLATMAIVVLSILSSHLSEERTELLREQNELLETRLAVLEELAEQTDFHEDHSVNEDDGGAELDEKEGEEALETAEENTE